MTSIRNAETVEQLLTIRNKQWHFSPCIVQGLETYDPLGEKFDPELHNALFEMSDRSKEPGTVAAVTKRGYKFHERVLRAAEVGVVKAE